MTQAEINTLVRPYILRQQARKRAAMWPWIFASLTLALLAASGLLFLALLLNL